VCLESTSQPIIDEAVRLANKDLGSLDLSGPYTLEKGLMVYFKEHNIDLEADFNRWVETNKNKSIERYTKELTLKYDNVKTILIDKSYVEYSAEIYKKAKDVYSGRTDDAILYAGEEKPKKISWNAIIKDPYPGSSLEFSLKEYLRNLQLYKYWHEKESVIISRLKEELSNRDRLVTQLDDVKINRRWKLCINIKFKE